MTPPDQSIPALPQADRRVSIRFRLTLWNMGVLVLILFGLGVVLRYALQATLLSSIDRDMTHGVQGIQRVLQREGRLPQPPPDAPTASSGELTPQIVTPEGKDAHSPDRPATIYDQAAFATATRTGAPVYSTVILQGQRFRILFYPLRTSAGTITAIAEFPRPLAETEQEVDRLTRLLFLLAGPGVLLSGIGGAFLTTRALRPVRQITQAAARIEAEDLSRRLIVTGKDELSELSATFNAMLARLEEAFRQRAAAYARMEEAYEQQRRFTADASHELKSPLTVIEGTVSLNLSSQNRTPEQYRRGMETIRSSAGRMTRIVQDLLLLAQADAGHFTPEMRLVSVYELLTLARDAVTPEETSAQAPLLLPDTDPHLLVRADPAHLVRLLVNLLENARRHTPPEGSITLGITADEHAVTLTVADTGSGIPAKDLPHIFDRFYRVDTARARAHGGTGLGLAIGRSIAEAHGGTLTLESEPGKGTTAFVRLPRPTASTNPE